MRRPKATIDNLVVRTPGLWWRPKAVATAALLLSLASAAWAQRALAGPATGSVDASFAALHEVLSATATDLLADAQHPPLMPEVRPAAASGQDPEFASALLSPLPRKGSSGAELQKALERVQALRTTLEPILREAGIPTQMAGVVLVESGGRMTALSPKGARGLWQIMPDTARRYGLMVSDAVDERLDPYKSTRAAASYLHDLYRQFGSWPLALAAYNAGEDAVQRAIDRASSRDFDLIARAGMLPPETRNYVPAVLSAISMMKGTADRYSTTEERKSSVDAIIYAVDRAGKQEAYE